MLPVDQRRPHSRQHQRRLAQAQATSHDVDRRRVQAWEVSRPLPTLSRKSVWPGREAGLGAEDVLARRRRTKAPTRQAWSDGEIVARRRWTVGPMDLRQFFTPCRRGGLPEPPAMPEVFPGGGPSTRPNLCRLIRRRLLESSSSGGASTSDSD